MRDLTVEDFYLIDDGTLDTVVGCELKSEAEIRVRAPALASIQSDPSRATVLKLRYLDASEYRDEKTGALDFERFVTERVIPDVESGAIELNMGVVE